MVNQRRCGFDMSRGRGFHRVNPSVYSCFPIDFKVIISTLFPLNGNVPATARCWWWFTRSHRENRRVRHGQNRHLDTGFSIGNYHILLCHLCTFFFINKITAKHNNPNSKFQYQNDQFLNQTEKNKKTHLLISQQYLKNMSLKRICEDETEKIQSTLYIQETL